MSVQIALVIKWLKDNNSVSYEELSFNLKQAQEISLKAAFHADAVDQSHDTYDYIAASTLAANAYYIADAASDACLAASVGDIGLAAENVNRYFNI